jgi:hypothetical protein
MDAPKEFQTILRWTLPRQRGGIRLRKTILTPGAQLIFWLGKLHLAWIIQWSRR